MSELKHIEALLAIRADELDPTEIHRLEDDGGPAPTVPPEEVEE